MGRSLVLLLAGFLPGEDFADLRPREPAPPVEEADFVLRDGRPDFFLAARSSAAPARA